VATKVKSIWFVSHLFIYLNLDDDLAAAVQ